ncbi:calcium-activated chloride channel regulator 3A-1 isoform X1 [Rhipicephalus microplus]|uniref:calcium-activated chloride channel regulator 3A-1 isoform X1 n=1 Tax=Rhipicephalus microplus TaxID=6941 RepID=UPI003F6A8ABC
MMRKQCLVVILIWFASSAASLEIDTSDGGYTNLLVSINRNVPYDESIIEDIKVLFTASSKFLHQATNGRVYFKQVTIEAPSTWPARKEARNMSSSFFEQSDIRIGLPGEPHWDRPFTQQLRPCGQPGDFIQLTPGFLAKCRNSTTSRLDNSVYKLVHEWAHFRYGVFDEYNCDGDSQYPLTYCNSGKASQFCDNTSRARQHNPFAPNKQNKLCQQRSAWEVISENADLRLRLTRPAMSEHIETSFVEIQETKTRVQCVVLVLDLSTSMDNYRRLDYLKEAVTRYINGIENDSLELAILRFGHKARIVHPLTPVNATTKPGFIKVVKAMKARGNTCIGCGLKKAIMHLESVAKTTEGAIIALLSDGQENKDPTIESVMPLLLKAKVVVNTLALGAKAEDKLEKLASETRGKAFAIKDMKGNTALEMEVAFVRATTPSREQPSQSQTLVDTVRHLNKFLKHPFQVDSSVGNDTIVYVKGQRQVQMKAWLVNPSGQRCKGCHESSTEAGIAILIPSPAEAGTWFLHLSSSDEGDVSIQVKSRARKEGIDPIQVSCTMADMLVDRPDAAIVYAKVRKGKKVVVGASVLAEVYGPKQRHASTLLLHDDGREPDNHAGDGTYSGYFTDFTGQGRYTVTAGVSYQYGTRVAYPTDSSACALNVATRASNDEITGSIQGRASENPMDDFILTNTSAKTATDNATGVEPVDPFERIASGGSFQVTKPIAKTDVPPGNIRDLAAAGVRLGRNGSLLAELTFTWPGAHLTTEKASSVEIRASTDYVKLKSDFDSQAKIAEFNTQYEILDPESSFTKHAVNVSLPTSLAVHQQADASAWSAYVAARTTNYGGLKSNTSNVVWLFYEAPPLSTTVATTSISTTSAMNTTTSTKAIINTTTASTTTTTERSTTKTLTTTSQPASTEVFNSHQTTALTSTKVRITKQTCTLGRQTSQPPATPTTSRGRAVATTTGTPPVTGFTPTTETTTATTERATMKTQLLLDLQLLKLLKLLQLQRNVLKQKRSPSLHVLQLRRHLPVTPLRYKVQSARR